LNIGASVYGVVAELVEMLGEVGQRVVDLTTQQVLTVIQLRKFHALKVARLSHCVSPAQNDYNN
jgi:hypothetical protein